MCWRLSPRSIRANDTVGFKDWTMHYEFVSIVLLPLLPHGLDDCDTTNKYVHAPIFRWSPCTDG